MSESAEAKWYVVHTYSGYENKVKGSIEMTVQNRNLEDQILEVMIPMESVVEIKDGKSKDVDRKMFPGYVLIHMIMNDDSWYVVRNTRGVTGFVGPGSKPVPLTEKEVAALGINSVKNDVVEVVVDYQVGETIKVISGAWENTVGVIKAVNAAKHSVTITVDMFGRETPVELGFTEIRHLD
ncbi:MAG: transcription termination/antitermination protein NusG [Lachnospiraceae bacterium]